MSGTDWIALATALLWFVGAGLVAAWAWLACRAELAARRDGDARDEHRRAREALDRARRTG